jgi:hypothetical protein
MNHISNSDAAWIAIVALLPVVLYLLFSAYQTQQRMSAFKAVIDKFSAAEDFAAFLQSPAGQKFVTGLSGSESPERAVIGGIQKGIILVLLGGGVWWTGAAIESAAEVATIGVLLMCIGAGLLISAGISYLMGRSLGLMDKPASESRQKLSEK